MDFQTRKAALGNLTTREITTGDAAAAAKLSEELGYPVSTEGMEQRIQSLAGLADHVVYVACLTGEVVGWIDVSVTCHLQEEPRAEIGGLVVSSTVRGGGIGRVLVECAERWTVHRGLNTLVVRSQISRDAAHRFYIREGFAQTKTSAVFTKKLS